MQILTQQEADKLMLLTGGREIAVSAKLKLLQPGQALHISRSEWKAKYAPTKIARRLEKQLGWKFRSGRLADNSGWLIQRIT